MFSSLTTYLKETRAEVDHITWPTQRQTVIYTTLVILLSVAIGTYLGVLDSFLTQGLNWFLTR
jgi:preprotein translocase SecE subunit